MAQTLSSRLMTHCSPVLCLHEVYSQSSSSDCSDENPQAKPMGLKGILIEEALMSHREC